MALNKALFSSDKEDWATPQDFFDSLNEEFHFNLDPCADPENAKCDRFFTKEENGLSKDWGGVAFFAIRHTAERQRENGSKSVTKKHKKRIRPLLRLYRRVLIQSFFTITYTEKRKSGS